jgi:hypothetical protein
VAPLGRPPRVSATSYEAAAAARRFVRIVTVVISIVSHAWVIAARGMVTPLAITTSIPKLTRYIPAFRKWSETGTATAPVASTRDEDARPLDQEGIDVRWTMCHNLGRSDCPRHVRNVLARHGNHPLLDSIMTQGGKLITCNLNAQVKADWTGVLSRIDGVVKDKGPRTMSVSISIPQHRTETHIVVVVVEW